MAEYLRGDGEKLLLAIIVAYEIQIRLSWACSPHLIYKGHHPPMGVGAFGSAIASSILSDFDLNTSVNALGIAGIYSAGLSRVHKNRRFGETDP